MKYKVVKTRKFERFLLRIPVNQSRLIIAKIYQLADNPYAKHNNVSKLVGKNLYRLRVGNWRIIYNLCNYKLELIIIDAGPRGGIYR